MSYKLKIEDRKSNSLAGLLGIKEERAEELCEDAFEEFVRLMKEQFDKLVNGEESDPEFRATSMQSLFDLAQNESEALVIATNIQNIQEAACGKIQSNHVHDAIDKFFDKLAASMGKR